MAFIIDDNPVDEKSIHPPNQKQLDDIREMAGLGVRPAVIAELQKVNLDDLMQSCGDEINAAALTSHKAVLRSLYNMATSERNVSATLFWIKTHCAHLLGLSETKNNSKSQSSSSKPSKDKPHDWDPDSANKRIVFTVYNNDGEPNADY